MLRVRWIDFVLATAVVAFPGPALGQTAGAAGNWKTWAISNGSDHGVPPPPGAESTGMELAWLRMAAQEADPGVVEQIRYWDSGPPSYRWMELIARRPGNGQSVGSNFARTYAYVAMAIHDATVAAWNAKYTYNRARPTQQDGELMARVKVPASPSYPSDYAATAAAAAAVMAYLVPAEAAYFEDLAAEAARSRLYAGVEYPSDYFAGLELGRRVAEKVIAKAKADGSEVMWTGTVPTGPCKWTGTNPGNAAAANWKPVLLASPSAYRPAPPPSCESPEAQADMKMVREYPRALTGANLNRNARALYWQTPEGVYPWAFLELGRWILEDKLESDPPRAARAYALLGAVGLDAFIASQDAKFAYWYPRPAQMEPGLTTLFPAPNFPSYPSNHSTLSAARAEILAYLFPERAAYIRAMGKEAGDSRIWAGIHFEMDNQAGVALGKSVAGEFIAWAKQDGSQQ